MKKECVKNGLEYELILQGSNRRALRQAGEYLPVDEELLKQFRSWQKRDSPTSTTTVKPHNDSRLSPILAAPIVQPGFGGDRPVFGADQLTEWFNNLSGSKLSISLPENFDVESINEAFLGTPLLPLPLALPPMSLPSLTSLPSLNSLSPSLNPMPSINPLPSLNSMPSLSSLPSLTVPTARPRLFNTPAPSGRAAAFPSLVRGWLSLGSANPDTLEQTEAPKP